MGNELGGSCDGDNDEGGPVARLCPPWAAWWNTYMEFGIELSGKGRGEADEDVWERAGIGTAWYFSRFVGWGREPAGRRLSRPRRARVCQKWKTIICQQRSLGPRLRSSFYVLLYVSVERILLAFISQVLGCS